MLLGYSFNFYLNLFLKLFMAILLVNFCEPDMPERLISFYSGVNATLAFEIYSKIKPATMEDPFNLRFKSDTLSKKVGHPWSMASSFHC
ncbi:hypothetical protein TNCT_10701 [Trichonephila clavata]|uniref:Uncharacterized protein n=1 Tax=Trichonephila clavata TaxID=2740835 RepID=A0A8X6FZU2_TRICU|nr:hypothetical protein TNCT_10701 [Trichonephila clavata]